MGGGGRAGGGVWGRGWCLCRPWCTHVWWCGRNIKDSFFLLEVIWAHPQQVTCFRHIASHHFRTFPLSRADPLSLSLRTLAWHFIVSSCILVQGFCQRTPRLALSSEFPTVHDVLVPTFLLCYGYGWWLITLSCTLRLAKSSSEMWMVRQLSSLSNLTLIYTCTGEHQ